MFKKIEKPAACEMRSVIRFLNTKNTKPAEIHRPYSPDSAPSHFHLFLHLKSFLSGRRFHDDEVKEAITTCFALQSASFYHERIQKLVQRYDKCLNNGGNYVER
jgi:hypothetical protein